MSNPLKISILDRTDKDDFKKLVVLLKNFTINTYTRNKPEFSELRGKKEVEVVNTAIQEYENQIPLSILTQEDIEQLKKEIHSQISSAKKFIDKKINGNIETRYYVMKDDDRMVSFYQVQLIKRTDNGRIEGWRNLMYVEQDYRSRSGQVIDTRGVIQEGLYTKIIYDDIGHYLEYNGVNYERICTGVNMLGNLSTYVRFLGFLPCGKNDKTIFLEKFSEHTVSRSVLRKAYSLYCQHRQRDEKRNTKQLLEEIESISEFDELTDEQKQGLVQCFLKESEKKGKILTDKLQMLNRRLQYLKHTRLSSEKGKDGFVDNIEDDKTRLSNMQSATKTVRGNVLGDGRIEPTNDEPNIE